MAASCWRSFALVRMQKSMLYLASVLLILSCQVCNVISHKSKSVSLVLDAKWKTTPLLLETSEFIWEENEKIFWQFIDTISQSKLDSSKLSEQELYDTTMAEVEKLLTAPQVSLLKFYLALRYYSPMIEMFQQISLDRNLPDCDAVVEINGLFTCDVNKIIDVIMDASKQPKDMFYKADHKYPAACKSPCSVATVLYGELGTKSFAEMHAQLKTLSEEGHVEYYIRHYMKNHGSKKVRLSGYGVELAIKSTEYKAQDDTKVKSDQKLEDDETEDNVPIQGFMFSTLKKKHPELTESLDKFKNHLLETSSELMPLKKWELQSISLQAAQKILSAPKEDMLSVMTDLSQNFPIRAKSLINVKVDEKMRKEVAKNQQDFSHHHEISSTDATMFINGIQYEIDSTDIFSLAGILRSEANNMNALHAFGLKGDVLKNLIKLDLKMKQEWAVDIRDSAVMYVNDIENDAKYRNWPTSLRHLLEMFHYGMLSNIRKNMFHMVIMGDPSKTENRFLYKLAESFYVHNAPVRIGLVFAVNPDMSVSGFQDAGVAMLNAFNFISTDKTPYDGLSFITDVYISVGKREIAAEDVINQFKKKYKDEDFELVFGLDSDYDTGRKLAWGFVNKTGMTDLPRCIINGVPLDQKKVTESDFEETALTEVIQQQQKMARAVYQSKLTDDDDVLDWLMSKGHVLPRLNKQIISNDHSFFMDFSGKASDSNNVDDFKQLSNADQIATIFKRQNYLTMKDVNVHRPNTILIVADLNDENGQQLLKMAHEYMRSSNAVRLGIVHNMADLKANKAAKFVDVVMKHLNHKQKKLCFDKLFKGTNLKDFISGKKAFKDFLDDTVDSSKFDSWLSSLDENVFAIHSHASKQVFNLKPAQMMLIADGKTIGPYDSSSEIKYEDFDLLERYSKQVYTDAISNHIQKLDLSPEEQSDMSLKVSSVLLSQPNSRSRKVLKYSSDEYSVLKIAPLDNTRPAMDIHVIVDPISRGAQKAVSLVNVLKEVVNANIKVFLNCQDKLSDLPLKSFYRYVLDPEPTFTPQDGSVMGPGARFTHMPTAPLFTLAMVTPDNWMVEAVKSDYDLDNIRLQDVQSVVYAEFELEHILLEGHCFEQTTGSPPRGLQFTLGNQKNPVLVDTIVMANLGYFQLKASPGAWILKLRPGRSLDIYDIATHENTDSPQGSENVLATINSFTSKVIKIRVSKKTGKEHKEILEDDEEEEAGIWSSIKSSFASQDKPEDENGVINIFSLASGHLYERFLRIMMLSVIKNTKSSVKFWFLKNFLSPTFKDFLPHMAKEYGFEYELVQYKWPRWLHQQTEKQRIIWGYKILFLDVLFPLDVKKIIFVDADQVVRTDMKELVDLDLEGAPYGYTPFCDSRTDMDGYRFWKSGYWANHLGRRRYHISALYVVDLKKFRQIAAGDRLRGQYHGLSQDPNSLSNLDQDLPNNMIHQVKIKSLPQHWLWCETWCDDASKKEAKTIDLCNNPKTKEPKLVSAMRIIAEWKDYDQEIKNIQDKIANNKSSDDLKKQSKRPDDEL